MRVVLVVIACAALFGCVRHQVVPVDPRLSAPCVKVDIPPPDETARQRYVEATGDAAKKETLTARQLAELMVEQWLWVDECNDRMRAIRER